MEKIAIFSESGALELAATEAVRGAAAGHSALRERQEQKCDFRTAVHLQATLDLQFAANRLAENPLSG